MRLHHKVRDMKPGETTYRMTAEPGRPLMAMILREATAALAEAGHDPIFVHVSLDISGDVVVQIPKEAKR